MTFSYVKIENLNAKNPWGLYFGSLQAKAIVILIK